MIAPPPVDRNRFARTARLLAPRQFQEVFANGKRVHGALLRLHAWLRADDANGARLGIAVPKRVAKQAVERNRIRRIVREVFRHRRQRLPAGDYVLVAQSAACAALAPDLRAELAQLWDRAGRLKPDPTPPTMPGCADPRAARSSSLQRSRPGPRPAPSKPPGAAKPSE
ncbi:MAG: ribonuclease P protein component [Proteobacteria bacterium]|nr:ribonuclease P protein component [Pseudomonadota bacterium]